MATDPPFDSEAARLRSFLEAIYREGSTVWPNTSCGRGGIGGQMMTTTWHHDAIDTLLQGALRGETLEQAADVYASMYPNARRLDVPSTHARRAGEDGRPL